jgi:hypothetical protein
MSAKPQNPGPSESLAERWRARAEQLERFAPAAAVAFRDCAAELDAQLRATSEAVLTIEEAALVSGFSKDHIRHQLAAGAIANVGRKGRPRVRAGDLPRKIVRTRSTYDPGAEALRLMRRGNP